MSQDFGQTFVVTPGDQWLINGEATNAISVDEIKEDIFVQATGWPVLIVVADPVYPFGLVMDSKTNITPAPENVDLEAAIRSASEVSEAEPESVTLDELVTAAEQDNYPSPSSAHVAEGTRQDFTPGGESFIRRWWRLGVIIVAVIGLISLMIWQLTPHASRQQQTSASESSSSKEPVELPEGAQGLAVAEDRVAFVKDGKVAVADTSTGDVLGDAVTVGDPAKTRIAPAGSSFIASAGGGKSVVFAKDGTPKTVDGDLNASGDAPVIVKDKTWRLADGKTGKLKDGEAVISGAENQPVIYQASGKITSASGETSLEKPSEKAKVTSLTQARNGQVVLLWTQDKTKTLVVHDLSSGKITAKFDVPETEQIKVVSSVVFVGAKVLHNRELTPLCSGGEVVSGAVVCPGEKERWKVEGQPMTFDSKPVAFSDSVAVSQDGRIQHIDEKREESR